MPNAFAQFDEPHAWLLRGLVEYGWPDVSRSGGHVPPGAPGGLNVTRLVESEGREGLLLEVPAVAGDQRCEDTSYQFTVQVADTQHGVGFAVRCPEASYLQEFPFNPESPLWAAGYIHQALTEYVPQFVAWRLQGGEVSWAQRVGLPTVEGQPCSFLLTRFLADRVSAGQPLGKGPQEGWWLDGSAHTASPRPAIPAPDGALLPQQGTTQERPSVGIGAIVSGRGGDPTYLSAAARAAAARGEPLVTEGNLQAFARVDAPGWALMTLAGLGLVQSLLWFVNAASVVLFYLHDSKFALAFSLVASAVLFSSSAAAGYGAWLYRKLDPGPLPWVAVVYAALVPGCCVVGLPVAIWAGLTWRDPMVVRARGG